MGAPTGVSNAPPPPLLRPAQPPDRRAICTNMTVTQGARRPGETLWEGGTVRARVRALVSVCKCDLFSRFATARNVPRKSLSQPPTTACATRLGTTSVGDRGTPRCTEKALWDPQWERGAWPVLNAEKSVPFQSVTDCRIANVSSEPSTPAVNHQPTTDRQPPTPNPRADSVLSQKQKQKQNSQRETAHALPLSCLARGARAAAGPRCGVQTREFPTENHDSEP